MARHMSVLLPAPGLPMVTEEHDCVKICASCFVPVALVRMCCCFRPCSCTPHFLCTTLPPCQCITPPCSVCSAGWLCPASAGSTEVHTWAQPRSPAKLTPDTAALPHCMNCHHRQKQDDLAGVCSCQLLKAVHLIPAQSQANKAGSDTRWQPAASVAE